MLVKKVITFSLLLGLLSCHKDGRLGGKTTLCFYPQWQSPNSNSSSTVNGATIYIWFDGTNAVNFTPKDTALADIKKTAATNDALLQIDHLASGNYAWRINAKQPLGNGILTVSGTTTIGWKDRNKTITTYPQLHY